MFLLMLEFLEFFGFGGGEGEGFLSSLGFFCWIGFGVSTDLLTSSRGLSPVFIVTFFVISLGN